MIMSKYITQKDLDDKNAVPNAHAMIEADLEAGVLSPEQAEEEHEKVEHFVEQIRDRVYRDPEDPHPNADEN